MNYYNKLNSTQNGKNASPAVNNASGFNNTQNSNMVFGGSTQNNNSPMHAQPQNSNMVFGGSTQNNNSPMHAQPQNQSPNIANRFNLLQETRKDLIGEIDAIIQYDNHFTTADNALTKATWEDIRDEETVHIGELLAQMYYLFPNTKTFVEEGMNEFAQRKLKLGM